MRAAKLAWILAAALLLPGAVLAQGAANTGANTGNNAAADTASAPLHSLEFSGSKRFSQAALIEASGLKVDAPATREDLQAAANRLSTVGCFSSIQYKFQTAPDGLHVQFQLADAPEFPASFDNFPWLTDDEISAAIKKNVPLFDGSVPEHGAILDSVSAAIEDALTLQDVHAKVTYSLLHSPITGEATEQFRAENSGVTIAGIEFSDDPAKSDRAIAEAARGLAGQPYSRDAIELFEFNQVRPLYLAHGYLDVRFPAPVVRLADPSGKPSPNQAMVSAPVEPGAPFTWSGVTWSGGEAVSRDDLNALVPFKPGDPADGTKIENLWSKVADAYGHLGYLDASVTPSPRFDQSAKSAAYTVTIVQGPQYHMGNLVLSGLSVVGEKRIRDAWKVPPGAVFDKTFYDRFLDTGITRAFAGLPIHYEKIGHYLQKDSQTLKADVMLDFQ